MNAGVKKRKIQWPEKWVLPGDPPVAPKPRARATVAGKTLIPPYGLEDGMYSQHFDPDRSSREREPFQGLGYVPHPDTMPFALVPASQTLSEANRAASEAGIAVNRNFNALAEARGWTRHKHNDPEAKANARRLVMLVNSAKTKAMSAVHSAAVERARINQEFTLAVLGGEYPVDEKAFPMTEEELEVLFQLEPIPDVSWLGLLAIEEDPLAPFEPIRKSTPAPTPYTPPTPTLKEDDMERSSLPPIDEAKMSVVLTADDIDGLRAALRGGRDALDAMSAASNPKADPGAAAKAQSALKEGRIAPAVVFALLHEYVRSIGGKLIITKRIPNGRPVVVTIGNLLEIRNREKNAG
jgi:hypothetical protein